MFYILTIFLVFLDLFTKYIAKIQFQLSSNILWDFLYFKYVENIWIAFSIWITWILLKVITIVLIIWIFYYYFSEEKKKNIKLVDLAFAFVLGWAIGNWYERIFNGKVIDFIWVKYFSVFNLADVFITLWVMLYIIYLFISNKSIKHEIWK